MSPMIKVVVNYSPDQPRAEDGKFGEGSGSSGKAAPNEKDMQEIPDWIASKDSAKDQYSAAAAFEFAGFTGHYVRLSASSQRKVFGAVLFGKAKIKATADGIRSVKKVAFGQDFNDVNLTWPQVGEAIKAGKPINW